MSRGAGFSARSGLFFSIELNPDTDGELVARSKRGELAAFEELVRRHERSLFSYLYRMSGNADAAEELAQAAFIRAWEGLRGFRGAASFKTWLFRIGRNLCLNRLTRTRPMLEISEFQAAPERSEPDATFRVKQQEELVQAALAVLPEEQRTALVLSVYEGLRYQEIARAMGKTVRAVDSLLVRAKRNVRQALLPARRKGIL